MVVEEQFLIVGRYTEVVATAATQQHQQDQERLVASEIIVKEQENQMGTKKSWVVYLAVEL